MDRNSSHKKRDRRNILTDAQKAPIIQHARVILSDPDSHDVPRLEGEINDLVYNLYNLTAAETKIVEG